MRGASSGATRRATLAGFGAVVLAPAAPAFAQTAAENGAPAFEPASHALSVFDDARRAADFSHFDYADPNAPKGGTLSMQIASGVGNQNLQTFNSLHVYVLKGDGAAGVPATFDSLMVRALDEPDAMYGLVARSVARTPDRRTLRFRLRPEARFHDGSALTAEDVAFSIEALRREGHPSISQVLAQVEGVEAPAPDDLVVRFRPRASRDAPLAVAGLPIFSKRFFAARPFAESTLEPVLGSGPYRVGRFEQGRFVEIDRVADYWARDLNVMRGQHNFDRIRYEYFRDRQVAFEAFKARVYLFREEFTSRDWARGYDFAAVREGRVTRETIPDETPSGAQGWFLNLRREMFADRRVREALGLAFDFEWTNANLMFGSYERVGSFFENSPMRASGPPSPAELALLEPLRASFEPALAADVFGPAVEPPKSDGSGTDRNNLRRAGALLREAGCALRDGRLHLPSGRPFAIEFLDDEGSLERHTNPFIANLGRLGIAARFRVVDPSQFQRRREDYDFDVLTQRYSLSNTPGEALKVFFGSDSAKQRGAFNLSGIAHPAVDALVEAALAAPTRAELTVACLALDRVLRALRFWVPMWHKPAHWVATWDAFGRPSTRPRFDLGLSTWWLDAAKARALGLNG